ncbi:MAG: PASTA domain-containing protein [Paludibacteraceae bacterium]|nr:PASTA domain-containing protein [Paludibacteraceae bacterium]
MKIDIKKLLVNPYTISIILMILIAIILYVGTLSWIDSYTNHNEKVLVPDLSDMTIEEAEPMLRDKNLKYTVIDSVYMRGKKLGVIVEQIPAAGSEVKEERTIYLTTNSNSIRKVVLPDVKEVSLRQAEAMINSVGLKVDSIMYVPSEYKDLVRDVRFNGKTLTAGSRIPEGSSVILMVGRGESNEEVDVPSLRSLTIEQSISKAHAAYLNIGDLHFDVQPKDEKDKDSYFVYKQSPITGTSVKLGETINLYLSKDPTTLEVPEEKFTAEQPASEGDELEQKDEFFQ